MIIICIYLAIGKHIFFSININFLTGETSYGLQWNTVVVDQCKIFIIVSMNFIKINSFFYNNLTDY